ncbi:MAG: glycosyltransferase family 4 protein [Promethearchaeota archaeon]
MKIVHITPFFGEQYGGSERYVNNLVKFHSKNHDIHIFSTTKHFSRRGKEEKDGYTLHRFYAPLTIWNINPVCYLLSSLATFEADIFHIHSYIYFASMQAMIAKYLSGTPTILHLHGGLGLPPYRTSYTQKVAKIFFDRFIGKAMVKGANIVASVSKFDIILAKKLFGNKNPWYVYMPNGVDTAHFCPAKDIKDDTFTKILYVGDIEPWKGIDGLINIIRNGTFKKDNIKFQFIGQGSLTPKILKVARKSENIEYLGQKNHRTIPSYMRNADMFVFPSKWEGTPTVVLEAMSCGLPVLATPVGDIPLIIRHKKNGMIFHWNGEELNAHIELLQSDLALKRSISSNARKFVEEKYDFSRIAKVVESYYYELTK